MINLDFTSFIRTAQDFQVEVSCENNNNKKKSDQGTRMISESIHKKKKKKKLQLPKAGMLLGR